MKIRKKLRATDPNVIAKCIVDAATTEDKNPAAVALGRLGGLKGGRARVDSMTPEQRKESASKAAQARWSKKS
jgi:hypothetical protein